MRTCLELIPLFHDLLDSENPLVADLAHMQEARDTPEINESAIGLD